MSDTYEPAHQSINRLNRYHKRELVRRLELASLNIVDARDLVPQVFEPSSAEDIRNRLYRIQEQIRELRKLVLI